MAFAMAAPSAHAQASAAPSYQADTPPLKALYHDGPDGRYLLGGAWLFRLDGADQGLTGKWQNTTDTLGWSAVTVPNVWNAGDASDASMAGSVGWYRKDFRLPDARPALSWVLRFESANYRATVWLNGRQIGQNAGVFLPFEVQIPPSALRRAGVNRLIVRVDSRRKPTDFPPSAVDTTTGTVAGGWWNFGGLDREVYLRRVDTADFAQVQVRPLLACRTCAARVAYRVLARNASAHAAKIALQGKFGAATVNLGTKTVAAGATAIYLKNLVVPHPRLWSPDAPNLYDAPLQASVGKKVAARYALRTGIRSIKVINGRLSLNFKPLNFRGVAVHEFDQRYGSAINNQVRDRQLAEIKEIGATFVRSHYPLHPYFQERADALGIMQWSEIPVYSVQTQYLAQSTVRVLAAKELQHNIETNQNHPSVIVWSIGNELAATPGAVQAQYIRRAATTAHTVDPTRPVGYALASRPSVDCQKEYDPLDIIGLNEYFGWYPGPGGQSADASVLSDYLDSVRACYPDKAIAVTEFGAEANREGPVEEKGTYAFQQAFVNANLSVFATKPWLSGADYWALEEFWVRPGWNGGNPYPTAPVHTKGLITVAGVRKPAFADVQRWYKATKQYPAPGG